MEKIGDFFLMILEEAPKSFFLVIFFGVLLLLWIIFNSVRTKKNRGDALKDQSF